ncbi:hypothetical protein KYT24_004362 [Salmonella enterica]|nr:hypothetical protein [Salmonella enterica]
MNESTESPKAIAWPSTERGRVEAGVERLFYRVQAVDRNGNEGERRLAVAIQYIYTGNLSAEDTLFFIVQRLGGKGFNLAVISRNGAPDNIAQTEPQPFTIEDRIWSYQPMISNGGMDDYIELERLLNSSQEAGRTFALLTPDFNEPDAETFPAELIAEVAMYSIANLDRIARHNRDAIAKARAKAH